METRNEVSEIRERFTEESVEAAPSPAPVSWLRALGLFTMLLAAAIAGGLLLTSCGGTKQTSAKVAQSTSSTVESATPASPALATPAAPASAARGLSASDVAIREGLPPDLSVVVPDTLVRPGQAVEFTVEGTSDVAEVALSDGRDDPLAFVRDSGTDTWRTQYRVPLHPKHERFGVSVTAKTDANRWRRVWVFLHVATGDSTTVAGTTTDPDEVHDEK